jgi:type VI secretion system secreted protein Hcp
LVTGWAERPGNPAGKEKTPMAVDMFIQINGIKGESRDRKYKDEIDVLAWSWGMSQSGTTHMGGGGGAGKVNIQDLSLTKNLDKASPALQLHCCNGKHIPDATLIVRKAGENPVEYLKIKMHEILVSSVSTGGSGGEDKLTENVSLNFAKVTVEYALQDDKGGSSPAGNYTWNIAENAKD